MAGRKEQTPVRFQRPWPKWICQSLSLRYFSLKRREKAQVELTILCYDRRADNIPMFVTSWNAEQKTQ
jgi:hypothetical protein